MLKRFINIFLLLLVFLFFFFIFIKYFSQEHISKIIDNRYNIKNNITKKNSNLPILDNDTANIIDYNSENVLEKNYKKRKYWDLLNINE